MAVWIAAAAVANRMTAVAGVATGMAAAAVAITMAAAAAANRMNAVAAGMAPAAAVADRMAPAAGVAITMAAAAVANRMVAAAEGAAAPVGAIRYGSGTWKGNQQQRVHDFVGLLWCGVTLNLHSRRTDVQEKFPYPVCFSLTVAVV